MVDVLCLDSEPNTVQTLTDAGHSVASGDLGYRSGIFHQPYPPHEFEAIVCDLRKPACYDALNWASGGNSNVQCTIVEHTTDETYVQSGSRVPRYKMVHGKQIKERGTANFDGHSVLNAVVRAGTHVFLMFNPEWAKHLSWSFPNFAGVTWTPIKTLANKVRIEDPLDSLLEQRLDALTLRLPLQFSMSSATVR